MEKSKLYTKTGDKGITCLYNGTRLSKSSIYFKLLGDLDELNCHIGMAKSFWKDHLDKSEIKLYSAPGAGAMFYRDKLSCDTKLYYEWYDLSVLTEVQCIIMDISSFIATPPWDEMKPIKGDIIECIDNWINKVGFDKIRINNIEKYIDRLDSLLPPITNFVVPGNNILVSSIHICRAVSRRCERRYLEFLQSDLIYYGIYDQIDTEFKNIQIYLNRLSDMFFALSRFLAQSLEITEECYSKKKKLFIQN
jgi:cob(I)alamin adenosyltransferase